MSHYKKLAKETMIYGLGTFVPRFLNFAFYTPYFTYKILSEFEFGLNSEIYAYIMFLMVLLTYGMETAFFKFSNDNQFSREKVYNNVFSSIIISTIIFLAIVFSSADIIKENLNFGGSTLHIKLMAGILGFDVLSSIPFAKLRNEKKIIKFSLLKIISVGVNIFFLFFFIKILPDFKSLGGVKNIIENDKISIILVSNLIASGIVFFALFKEVFAFKFSINKKIIIPILVYASPLLVSQLAGQINETLDKLIYRHLLNDGNGYEELAMYSASYKLGVILSIFNQMFRFASEPYFFSILKEKDSKEVYANILKYFLLVSLIVFLVINFYVDFFKFYLGPDFREGLFILPIVLFSYVLSGILINVNYWFKLSSNTKWAIIIIGSGAIVTIISNLILVPVFHYTGSAVSHVIANLVMIVLSYLLGKKFYKIEYDIKSILFYVLLASIIFALGYFIQIESIFVKTIYVSLLLLTFIFVIEKKENLLKTFIKK